MADTKADVIHSEGVEVAHSPDSVNFTDGLEATEINGAVDVGIKDGGVKHKKMIVTQTLAAGSNGAFTANIDPDASFVTVTSGSATAYVVLPPSDTGYIGRTIKIWVGSNGFELVTPESSNDTINGQDGDGSNQLDVGANTLVFATQVSATAWICLTVAAGSVGAAAADND